MDDDTRMQIVIDALQSVIRDCDRYVAERRDSDLVVISEDTQRKVEHALRLFDELDAKK